jgi:transglutaminase-like putative cysteine protease
MIEALRKSGVLCTVLAILPLAPQLPATLLLLIGLILAVAYLLPKPHLLLIIGVLIASLLLLMFAYNGRVGRDTAAAMLALMMALKCLETTRMRDLRALLGFALFLPFSALLSVQTPLTLALCLLSVLFWLLLLQISSTGKIVLPEKSVWPLLKALLRAMLIALPMAAALFWLFPRIGTPLWGLPGLSEQGTGLGDSMKPGQWLDILADDRIAFRVDFTGRVPEPEQRYWRGPVLWDFDGMEWQRNPQDNRPGPVMPANSPEASDVITYRVSLEPTERKYLPVLDWPRQAPEPYTLSADTGLYASTPIQKMTQYSASAWMQPDATRLLGDAERRRALAYPTAFNKRTQALALQWRAQAGNDRAYIDRVLQWIRRDFSYTLATDPPRLNAVDRFLFEDRQGFCQHFSSSFAMLMRAAGIPARVVTGYVGGYRNPYGGYWVLYIKDAHAWTEVWLEGEGWVRIDPTAAVAPENILDTLAGGTGQEQYAGGGGAFSPLFDYGDFMRSRWNDWVIGFNAARQMALFRNIGIARAERWQMLLTLLILAGLISFAVFNLSRRTRITEHPVDAAWHRLIAVLAKRGHQKAAHETAMDFAARSGDFDLMTVASRYSQWRYGKADPDPQAGASLIADIQRLTGKIKQRPPSGSGQRL